MGIYYFDSSAMVKHYITERGSEWVSSLIEAKIDEKPQNLEGLLAENPNDH